MLIRTDCRHYRATTPCAPHKASGVRCEECALYEGITERILIVKLDAMGDVLRTTSCLPALKAAHPHAHVTWLTRRNAISLLAPNRLIDRVLAVESNYQEFLLAEQFTLALCPDPDPLSASILSLVRSTTKRGFVADGRGGVTPLNDAARAWWQMGLDDELKQRNRRTYGEWLLDICELHGPVPRPSLEVTPQAKARVLDRLRQQAPGLRRWIAFNVGGSRRWEEKRWKAKHYRQLALSIQADDPRASVLLIGGPDEIQFHRELLATSAGFVDGGTDNTIEDFAALLASCEWVLTSDSLGYHVACAVHTPAICVVGPTSPWELDTYESNRVLYSAFECIGCYRTACPLAVTCMDALTPDVVWTQVRAWKPALAAAARAREGVGLQ